MATNPAAGPALTFRIITQTPLATFAPRFGNVVLTRPPGTPGSSGSGPSLEIATPSFIATTSRGVIPHLSRDNVTRTKSLDWINVPFESFLEQVPPVPTQQPGQMPLHTFLGFNPLKHILSLTLRDPADDREMPPNGNDWVSAKTVRGVRKVTPLAYRSYASDVKPDIVFALSDIPFTPPPFSQRRLTRSIERSLNWLSKMLAPPRLQNVLVQMVGGASAAARAAFASGLTETLYGKEADAIRPLSTLDEGVSGYVFDLVPLRNAVFATHRDDLPPHAHLVSIPTLLPLIKASLDDLPPAKLRVVNTARSPHDILQLVQAIGIDLFDSGWIQQAASWGVALDFSFPAPETPGDTKLRPDGTRDVGRNLFDEGYSRDWRSLRSTSTNSKSDAQSWADRPTVDMEPILHSTVDSEQWPSGELHAPGTPFTRAYINHLLHTHEMSSHTILAIHNFSVLDDFFKGIRALLAAPDGEARFSQEVERFHKIYDSKMTIIEEARRQWAEVDRARGKGHLAREKKEADENEHTE